ncbi:uncharacterized protein EAE98_011022 [Botrytis deweyae]|uniref:C2H2-type domain-containing protein n=1 Tax=Botrytis deweyae TaxID=2478750 RepID=A0ABQ7I7L9_9HELO|nr:uncharacterized protein EAE98_011022 [Botrytis deweyae]KAF7915679.1 hypothetical protein EAE98_011022 [Botrytis deweyae]
MDDETRGSRWANLHKNLVATPPAPLTESSVNDTAPNLEFDCHYIGCGRFFVRQDKLNDHMKRHGAPLESTLEPLGIYSNKEEFMKHLQIDHETFALMEARFLARPFTK